MSLQCAFRTSREKKAGIVLNNRLPLSRSLRYSPSFYEWSDVQSIGSASAFNCSKAFQNTTSRTVRNLPQWTSSWVGKCPTHLSLLLTTGFRWISQTLAFPFRSVQCGPESLEIGCSKTNTAHQWWRFRASSAFKAAIEQPDAAEFHWPSGENLRDSSSHRDHD